VILPYLAVEFKARRIERQKKVGAQSGLYLPEEDISAQIVGIEQVADMKRFELLRR
jgi:hypothetical protein